MTLATETRAERDLRRLRTLYRALGDETRLRVISLLAEFGPMPVNELSARSSVAALISWHLRILRLSDLVETQRQGASDLPPADRCLRRAPRARGGSSAGPAGSAWRAEQRIEVADVG
jgi:DNA-binding transcriptional ArsR family regulator